MKEYNGFSPSQRAEGGRLQAIAFSTGHVPRPTVCRACDYRGEDVMAHLEDYARPLEAIIPLCKACHYAVHARFSRPAVFARHREAVMRGALPHQNDTPPAEDLLGDIAAGKYLPTPEAVALAPEYRGRHPGYWLSPYVPAARVSKTR